MGWGEPAGTNAADRLADAVERWLNKPTTGNAELMAAALAAFRPEKSVGLAPVPEREAAPANTAVPHGKESAPDSSKAAK